MPKSTFLTNSAISSWKVLISTPVKDYCCNCNARVCVFFFTVYIYWFNEEFPYFSLVFVKCSVVVLRISRSIAIEKLPLWKSQVLTRSQTLFRQETVWCSCLIAFEQTASLEGGQHLCSIRARISFVSAVNRPIYGSLDFKELSHCPFWPASIFRLIRYSSFHSLRAVVMEQSVTLWNKSVRISGVLSRYLSLHDNCFCLHMKEKDILHNTHRWVHSQQLTWSESMLHQQTLWSLTKILRGLFKKHVFQTDKLLELGEKMKKRKHMKTLKWYLVC